MRKTIDIVCCKECKHYHENVWGTELGLDLPLIVGHCACDFFGREKDMVQVYEDGFCAWGEREEE